MKRLTPKQIGAIRSAISAIERQEAPITQEQAARRIELYKALEEVHMFHSYTFEGLKAAYKLRYHIGRKKALVNKWRSRYRAAVQNMRWVEKTSLALQLHRSSRNEP